MIARLKKQGIRIGLGLLVVLVFLLNATGHVPIAFVHTLEAITYDARLRLTMPGGVDPRVVIVDIDEKSLTEEGRWPWRRDRIALLIDKLISKHDVAAIGFDVVFAERDESSGLNVLRELADGELKNVAEFRNVLEAIAPKLEYDQVLAKTIQGKPVVLGYFFSGVNSTGESIEIGAIPKPVLPAGTFKGRNIGFKVYPGYGGNLSEFQNVAASGGHFMPVTDADGIHRRVPMLAEYKGAYYEPLALAIVRLLDGSPKVTPVFGEAPLLAHRYAGLEYLDVGARRIPVDDEAAALVPYRGPQNSFRYLSATDLLRDRVPNDDLKGRIVLVGTTAAGLKDLRSTPVGTTYPGVEIHANLIVGMLDGNIKERPAYVVALEVVLLALVGVALTLAMPVLTPRWATTLALVVLTGLLVANLAFWTQANLVVPMASGLLMVITLYALDMAYGYFVESRAKQQIAGRFGQYVPPELVDEMSRNPDQFSMEGDRREMTVLFTDMRGFTTISEGLDPQVLSKLMNEFLTPMTQVIHRHRGTIDKYIGDAIMAFWGAPMHDANHARNAVLAGLEMLRRVRALAAEFRSKGWPAVAIGVGVNTGRMSVGNMGSDLRVSYTVMGDAVNLASRIEGITKQYGVSMLVGEGTRAAVDDVVFREVDRVRVKGKDAPVAIYEPVGLQGEVDKTTLDRLKLFQQALKFYRAQDWDKAELQWLNLQKLEPGVALHAVYLKRIAHFRAHPPAAQWDGVFDFETK